MMSDPTISEVAFDTLDAIPNPVDGEIIERDGLLYIQTGGRKYVSRNMGQIYTEVYPGGDCDGLTRSPYLNFSKCPPPLTNIRPLTEVEMRLFDDTPGPDGTGAKLGVQVEVPAEGWPDGWAPFGSAPFVRSNGRSVCPGEPTAIGWSVVLPNTEPGRIAAWVLEGK